VLARAFAGGAVEKRYLALVRGWPPCSGTIDHPLTPRDDDAESMSTEARAAAAQRARTDYRRLATIELPTAVDRHPTTRYALVDVRPRTGRRHQIRRHLKHVAHPLLGDATFGKGVHNRFVAALTGMTRLWLHAWWLAFPHPRADVTLRIQAPLGIEWGRLLDWPGWRYDAAPDGDQVGPLAMLRRLPPVAESAGASPSASDLAA
jgi:tRNA pseudouridine65 synthase